MESMRKKLKQKLRVGSSSQKDEERWWFMEHGSRFLTDLIADCNGESIPIRNFSASQILKATNNFDSRLLIAHERRDHKWYKGIIEDKPYLIKRFIDYNKHVNELSYNDIVLSGRISNHNNFYNDIVLSTRMSNHSNFLRLIGPCLEFRLPAVVFEDAEHGVLNEKGCIMVNGEERVLPWSVRLKIAKEIANALTYLHTAFSKITVHLNVKPTSIFLDENWKAKLSDFSNAITLPEGKSRIEVDQVHGVFEYLDPLYYTVGLVTEYTDVYSFGVCLLVYLTGRSASAFHRPGSLYGLDIVRGFREMGKLSKAMDPMIMRDSTSDQRMQVKAYMELALRCCVERDQYRPKMIEIAKELKRIESSFLSS